MDELTITLKTKVGALEVKRQTMSYEEVKGLLAYFDRAAEILLGHGNGQKSNGPVTFNRLLDGSAEPSG